MPQLLKAIESRASETKRLIVAIAGPPGSGKSTIAARLADGLHLTTTVVPMDGFHRDNADLEKHGLYDRKGAPETFDAAKFVDLVRTLRHGEPVPFPIFDRTADQTVLHGGVVDAATRVVLVEGNYLLLKDAPWSELAGLFDLTVSLAVPREDLQSRLIARWCDHGLSLPDATARAVMNDMKNVDFVQDNAISAEFVLHANQA